MKENIFCFQVCKNKFGCEPKIEAIHAGLECGLFSGRIEGLEAISYEPYMWDVHTPVKDFQFRQHKRCGSFWWTY